LLAVAVAAQLLVVVAVLEDYEQALDMQSLLAIHIQSQLVLVELQVAEMHHMEVW
jgi:hypothetical protein